MAEFTDYDRRASRAMTYRADLDGLRAVAVLLVMAAHAQVPFANDGGTTGVTAFFVLSGYLITRLLLVEREATGRIDLKAFYLRRILRLGPALLLLIAFVAIVGLWRGWAGEWRFGIAATLLYVGNWAQVAGYQIAPLGHTWTLAIEEQFYLMWPIVMMLASSKWTLRLAIAGIILGAAAGIAANGYAEYFSTITRGNAILAGCILGIVRPRVPTGFGVAGLVLLLVVSFLNLPHDIALPIAILGSCLAVSCSLPVLGYLAPIGRRSYGLYLWNYPLTILFGPVAALLTFVAASLSYRLVERPLTRRFGPALHRGAKQKDDPEVPAGLVSGTPPLGLPQMPQAPVAVVVVGTIPVHAA